MAYHCWAVRRLRKYNCYLGKRHHCITSSSRSSQNPREVNKVDRQVGHDACDLIKEGCQ
jgi:hypothetical protein